VFPESSAAAAYHLSPYAYVKLYSQGGGKITIRYQKRR